VLVLPCQWPFTDPSGISPFIPGQWRIPAERTCPLGGRGANTQKMRIILRTRTPESCRSIRTKILSDRPFARRIRSLDYFLAFATMSAR